MRDELGDRMKKYYEDRTRILLPRRTYTIIRIDGKAFHTYTRGLKRPFDDGLIDDMDATACYLCKNIQGAKFAFVQSDEISVLMTDFEAITTDAWFDGNIQKIASIAASLATAKFNQLRMLRNFINLDVNVDAHGITAYNMSIENIINQKLAEFDARVFTIPSDVEVENYFIWRQQDTVRNSISSVAQTLYSHKELEGKNMSEQQEMIFQKGTNWNDFAPKYKRGRFIAKVVVEKTTDKLSPYIKDATYIRNEWQSIACPTFTKAREFLTLRIPKIV
jgi:tRNA(His) guanylyltransferase